jgi:single-strand DNA-binding protein
MINKVILVGNVGLDPEIRSLSNGTRVANFSLATTEYWKGKDGNRNSNTEWHRIVVYNENLVKIIEKAVHKGSKLYIEGSIRSRKYTDSSGAERTVVEVILSGYNDTVKLLDSKASGEMKEEDHRNDFSKKDNENHNESEHDDSDEIPF